MRKKEMTVLISACAVLVYSLFAYIKTGEFRLPEGAKFSSGFRKDVPLSSGEGYEDMLVSRVVDGDTLVLGNRERVRLIGIDTPETHESNKLYRDARKSGRDVETIKSMGKRAYLFTKGLLEGQRVRLEFDVEQRDRYGRLLAYVFMKDGSMANARIIEAGYAQIYTFPPNVKYVDLFKRLQEEARENNRGLWGKEK